MAKIMIFGLFLFFINISCIVTQQTPDVDALTMTKTNWCIDAKHHKSKPGPEGKLFGQCTPWKERSCCQANTTEEMHTDLRSLYNFRHDHCPHKKVLSDACKKHFTQDHCFYECSPNVGPWVVKEKRSWNKERFYKVPLCASDCNAWFESCVSDYTCTDNWSKNFKWTESTDCYKGQTCKQNYCISECKTFLEIFKTAKNFCENVWDDSWEYTPDDEPCMRLWFDEGTVNPNDAVALWKAKLISKDDLRTTQIAVLVVGVSVVAVGVFLSYLGIF